MSSIKYPKRTVVIQMVADFLCSVEISTAVYDENINLIKKPVVKSSRISLRDLVLEVNLFLSPFKIIPNAILGMKCVAIRLVPLVAEDMISRIFTKSTFTKRILIDDETWVYQYDMQTN